MKITKQDLSKLSDLAKYYYRQESNSELSDSQLVAQAWVKAVCGLLFKEVEIELPNRVIGESVFDD